MFGCESWTIKKAECQRIDAFELWWWRRLSRVPQTARRSNQSILKEISPEYSLEGLMLKLKLHYFGYLIQRTDSFEKTLMLEKIEGRRRRGPQRMRWLDGITNSKPGMLQSGGSQRMGRDSATELYSHLFMTNGKTIALTMRTFVGRVISLLFLCLFLSLLFNTLSRFAYLFFQGGSIF